MSKELEQLCNITEWMIDCKITSYLNELNEEDWFFHSIEGDKESIIFQKRWKITIYSFTKCYTVVFFTFKYFKMWAFELLSYLPVIRGFSAEKIKY